MERRGEKARSVTEQIGRGKIAPVYCLHGEDDYRREEALTQLINALLTEGVRDLNLEQIRPEEAGTGSILGGARTLPFLSTHRVILIRGAEALSREQQEEVLAYLNDSSPTTCLVLSAARLDLRTRLAAAIQKKGVVLRFDRLEAGSLQDSLLAAARGHGKHLSPEAIDLLITLAGDDLRQLIYSVEKAALFVGEGEEIGPQDIEALVGETRARSIFQLTDAVGARDLDTGLRCLSGLLEGGEEPLAILGMLARQIRLLVRAKALQQQSAPSSAMARALGLPPRVVATIAEQAALLSWQQLSDSFRCLSGADLAIKTGRAGAPLVLNRLVWDLCRV
ncbi:MAG: DNA polymerase III subunit delta [candidate division NC10 bacterium]|nr:DNA polymerase III subunit delta [candidate division NC10 bacterium]